MTEESVSAFFETLATSDHQEQGQSLEDAGVRVIMFRSIVLAQEPVSWETIRALSESLKERLKFLYKIQDLAQLREVDGLIK